MTKKQSVGAIICAAGKGQRAGFTKNKLLVPFEGTTLLFKTISAFDFPAIDEIIVTANAEDMEEVSALCENFPRCKAVLGGFDRSHSVYNALKECSADITLIHDGARAFVSREIIEDCIESVKANGSGICSMACSDTVAVTQNGKIISVPQRDTLRQIQTPQGFFRENILSV